VPYLLAGSYQMVVEAQGFKKYRVRNRHSHRRYARNRRAARG
jgi:hypothetical protein